MTLSDRTQTFILAGLLALLALAIRGTVVAHWHFDGLYGQDSYAYFQQAQALAHGNLPTDFFWPNGLPLLIAGFIYIFGNTPTAAQLAVLVCGILLPAAMFLLVRELFVFPFFTTRRQWAAFSAGLIVAVAGQLVLSSVVVMADIPALLWATLAAWLTVRAVRPQNSSRATGALFFAAGAALGLAVVTRWVYALVVPALVGFALYRIIRRRQRFWPAAFAPAAAALVIAPQLALSRHRPDSLLHSWLLGWHPLNFFAREFQNVDGHFVYPLPNGLFAALPAGHPAYLFPVLGLAALWGGIQLWRTRRTGVLILLAGWAAPVYLFLGGIPYQNFRFGLTLYLPLVALAGIGVGDWAAVRPKTTTVLLGLSLAAMLAWTWLMLDHFITPQQRDVAVARQVAEQLPAEATLLTFGLTLTVQNRTPVAARELFYQTPDALTEMLRDDVPLYLLVDVENIDRQWAGLAPQNNYRWLRSNAEVTPVSRIPPYTLFRVEAADCKSAAALAAFCLSHPGAAVCR